MYAPVISKGDMSFRRRLYSALLHEEDNNRDTRNAQRAVCCLNANEKRGFAKAGVYFSHEIFRGLRGSVRVPRIYLSFLLHIIKSIKSMNSIC
jgi:hypothetical protein